MSLGRNALYNLSGAVLPMLLALATIPAYIKAIGEARYGVLAIAWLLLDYFGLFDLGLGRAMAQRLGSAQASSAEEQAKALWTAIFMILALGLLGGLLIGPTAAYYVDHSATLDAAFRTEFKAALPWLVVAVPVATLSAILGGALQGRSRFLALNAVNVTNSALMQTVPLGVALWWAPSIDKLLACLVLCRLTSMAALWFLCRRHILLGSRPAFALAEAKGLLHFGGWMTASAVVGPLMTVLDRFAISSLLGARAVAHYTVPMQLVQRTNVIPGALASALLPQLAAAPPAEADLIALASVRTLAAVMTPLLFAAVFVMEPFLSLWINPGFAQAAAPAGRVLALAFWFNAFAVVPQIQLLARRRPDLVAKAHMAELLPYLLGLYVGLQTLGMVGAAWVFCVRTTVDWVVLARLAGSLAAGASLLWRPALLMGMGFAIATAVPVGGMGWWAGLLLSCTLLAWWALKTLPAGLRLAAGAGLRRMLGRA